LRICEAASTRQPARHSTGGPVVAWDASDRDAPYDDRVTIDAAAIEPTVTWGINPGQAVGVSESIPADADAEDAGVDGIYAMGHLRTRMYAASSARRRRESIH